MDLDAPFAMPSFMPGCYNIEDRFSVSDGTLYDSETPLQDLSLKGEDEGSLTHTMNANDFDNCIECLSPNHD